MLSAILFCELLIVLIAGLFVLPGLKSYFSSLNKNEKLLACAWSAMLIGQHQIFAYDEVVQSVGQINAAVIYQLSWMFVAGMFALPLLLSGKIYSSAWRYPIIAFAIYIFFAFVTTAVSASPLITFYRAMQISVDLVLLLIAYSEFRKTGRWDLLLNVTIFWLVILLCSVVLNALLIPEQAFVANEGALGESLRGVIPSIHQNELGLYAAMGLLISVIRGLGGGESGKLRLFWFAMIAISGTILYLAQARTSLGGAIIALVAVGFMIRRLRWLGYSFLLIGAFVSIFYLLSGSSLGIEDDIETYARRGTTDEQLQSLSGRTWLWGKGMEMLKDAPVIGHGFQAGVRYEGVEYGLALGTNMHNAHMQVLVDSGIAGYITWFIFVFGMSKATFLSYRKSRFQSEKSKLNSVGNLLIIFVILFRSLLGQVLVSNNLNLLMLFSVYLASLGDNRSDGTESATKASNIDYDKKDVQAGGVLRPRKNNEILNLKK